MLADVAQNKHLAFFLTDNGFGSSGEPTVHPMLEPSGVKIGDRELLNNDLFRAVHDYFGHTQQGFQFGPRGEFNAWKSHSKMFSDEAQGALAAETLAQNAWVNFGPHLRDASGKVAQKGEPGYVAPEARPFADQRAFVLPDELRAQLRPDTDTPQFKKWFGDSKVVDSDGAPAVVYHGTGASFNKFSRGKSTQGIFWFTSDKAAVDAGEVGAQGRGRVLELYASLKNPAGWKEYDRFGLGELRREGYDGAILRDADGSFTGFAFEPEQLKSATKNRGTFDPKDADIRHRPDTDGSNPENSQLEGFHASLGEKIAAKIASVGRSDYAKGDTLYTPSGTAVTFVTDLLPQRGGANDGAPRAYVVLPDGSEGSILLSKLSPRRPGDPDVSPATEL